MRKGSQRSDPFPEAGTNTIQFTESDRDKKPRSMARFIIEYEVISKLLFFAY